MGEDKTPRKSDGMHCRCGHVPGFTLTELLVVVFLLFAVMGLTFGLMADTGDGGGGSQKVPPYRVANAMYIQSALERQRVAILNYMDLTGALPGDDARPADIGGVEVRGDGDGRIEKFGNENVKLFVDLAGAKLNRSDTVRVRGQVLDLYWASLDVGGRQLAPGNFFYLSGIHPAEAIALDARFDDGQSDRGDIVFSVKDDKADLYVRLKLIQ